VFDDLVMMTRLVIPSSVFKVRCNGGQAIVGNVTQASRATAAEQVTQTTPQLTHAKEAPMMILGE
jgi:hypothetical protein